MSEEIMEEVATEAGEAGAEEKGEEEARENQAFSFSSCPSCETERVGDYCHGCGQRYPSARLSVPGLIKELPARFFNLDRGFFHTFFQLLKCPGKVARNYVNGSRGRYISPLTFFLVAATLHLLALTLSQDLMIEHIGEQIGKDPTNAEELRRDFGEGGATAIAKLFVSVLKQGYTYLFLIFMSFPFAVYLRALTRRLNPRYNLAELLVFSIYSTAQIVLISGLLLLITTRIQAELQIFATMATYIYIGSLAARDFFDGGISRIIRTLIAMGFAFVTFVFSLSIFLVILMFMHRVGPGGG